MAMEKKWGPIPPQSFSADGTADGHISVLDSTFYWVKQKVRLFSDSVQPRIYQIQRINNLNDIELGPEGSSIDTRSDLSGLTVSDNAKLSADFQPRPTISWEDIRRAVYEEEPTVALRTMLVDKLGNRYTETNPLPVDATINVDHLNVDIENPGAPTIINITVPDADTEQSYTFPANTKRFKMKVRGGRSKIQIAYESGESGTNYFTNEMGNIYQSGDIDPLYPFVVYFQCNKDAQVIEIESWANL